MPRIAIPQPHDESSYTVRHLPLYVAAIEGSGATAVILPLHGRVSELAQMLKHCDAALLPGCHADIDPQLYSQPPQPQTSASDPLRAALDDMILQDAYNMRKPLLGICYGAQSLDVWRLGALCQHLETSVRHARLKDAPQQIVRHAVAAAEGSHLASLLAARGVTGEFPVQSSHHQAIERLGDRLRVAALSPADGVIEAIEGTETKHFVLGVQWHPERSVCEAGVEGVASRALFAALTEAATAWHTAAVNPRDFETA
jgi:putative glutamine amidotransferase